jgi:hypothetical protein
VGGHATLGGDTMRRQLGGWRARGCATPSVDSAAVGGWKLVIARHQCGVCRGYVWGNTVEVC